MILLEYIRLPHNTQADNELAGKRKQLLQEVQLLNRRGLPVTTNTLNDSVSEESELMRESDLIGDYESDLAVTQGPIVA
jgi:hypothetical protein